MFGVSGGELIILLLIGLVVLGPERLPRVANQIGGWLGQARRMTRVMKRQLEEELDLNETLSIKSPPPPSREPSTQPESTVSKPASQAEDTQADNPQPDYTLPREDDDYSPAHEADAAGTGVGEEIYDDVEDLAVTEAGRMEVADATDNAPAADDSQAVEKKSSA